jgi:superfamily II DNA or RNA helicase
MTEEKDFYLYELQCMKYHQNTFGHVTWHWTKIPENVLFESGFIHDFNEYRLKRKLKWEENKEYYNPLREYGLDGICLEIRNEVKIYHGIQCKLWQTKLCGNDLGTFLLSIYARLNITNKESKGYLYHTGLLEINLKNDLERISHIITPIKLNFEINDYKNQEEKKIELYDYQKEAIQNLDNGWNKIGYLISPCGTGKTVIFLKHLQNQKYKNIIIVSPLKIQVKQTFERVNKNLKNYKSILLDSDNDGTNDFQEIEKNWDQNLIISTTFKSFQDILIQLFNQEYMNILESRFNLSETLLIIDEAHNIINLNKMIQMIKSFQKVLLVTATPPKILNELIVGKVIYQYSMQKAIENHHICDYQIYLPQLNYNNESHINIPDDVEIENKENELIYKKIIFLIEGLLQTGSKKCIVYLTEIEQCYIFEKIIKSIIEKYYYLPYWIGIINCDISTKDREELLSKFQETQIKSDIRILLSIRILDEGIDIPKCDSVFITSVGDYNNDIRMIQRLCRAVRIDSENINKKANCFIWTDNMNKIYKSLKVLKENDINFIEKITYNKKSITNSDINLIKIKEYVDNEYFEDEFLNYYYENKYKEDTNFNEINITKNKKYECDICKINFDKKCDLERHLLRQKGCSEKTKNSLQNKIFICEGCGKGFSQKRSLKVHIDEMYCKKNIKDKNNVIIDKNEYEKLKKYQIENIKKLYAFGKEIDVDIPFNLFLEATNNIAKGISLLIKFINFNKDFSENENIKGKGLSSKYLEIYNGENWMIENKKKIFKKMIIKNKRILDYFVNGEIKKYKELQIKNEDMLLPYKVIERYEKDTEKLDEVLNQDFRDKKPREESIEIYKEVEEELNMLLESERIINKEKELKQKEDEKIKKKLKRIKKLD